MRLRELRKESDLTMKELGKAIGVAESTVSAYETGKREPDLMTLCKIADYFRVSLDYLLGRETAAARDIGDCRADGDLSDFDDREKQLILLSRKVGKKHGQKCLEDVLEMMKDLCD